MHMRITRQFIAATNGTCPAGNRLDKENCLPCTPGSYSSGGSNTSCLKCPKGFYMPKEGAETCLPCPGDKTTVSEGAYLETECYAPVKAPATNQTVAPKDDSFLVAASIISAGVIGIAIFLGCIYFLKKSGFLKFKIEKPNSISDVESTAYESSSEDSYEVPIKRKSLQSAEDHEYEDLLPNKNVGSSPIRNAANAIKSMGLTIKRKILGEKSDDSKDEAKEPLKDSLPTSEQYDDHIYEDPTELRKGSVPSHTAPSPPTSKDDHIYEEPIKIKEKGSKTNKPLAKSLSTDNIYEEVDYGTKSKSRKDAIQNAEEYADVQYNVNDKLKRPSVKPSESLYADVE